MQALQRKPGNYLGFDGGHSALPGLSITEEICTRLQYDLESDDEICICDHCDLLGGSGAGAVSAILLGRMGLTTSQAIKAYLKLEPTLSVQPTKDEEERRRNSEAFRAAFTKILVEAGFAVDTPMMDKSAPKTVVWTLSAANLSIPQPIRSYRVRSSPGPSCTILEAACASIASPNKFIPVTLVSGHKKVVLVDAMAGYANPTNALLKEAQDLFGDEAEVASIVSLGAGKGEVVSITGTADEDALADALRRMILDSERTHEEIYGRLNQLSIYFRFNVERGLEQQVDTSSIYECTTAYMKEGDINKLLDNAVKSINNRQKGSTLMEINSVTTAEITMKPRPSLVRNFVGREDILEKMSQTHIEARSPDPGLPAITVLMGLGGSGKTQIALKFALDYEKKQRDATVHFFNASSEAKLKADYELAIRIRDSASRSKSSEDALVWFANRQDPWLIIMDNADDPSVDLFRLVPKSSHGNVIITTRNSTYKILAPNSSHHVEGLAASEAVELILKGSTYGDDEENRSYAWKITEALGHFPLALAHAVGYISVHRCLPTYLDMFLNSRLKFLASKPPLPQDYNSTLAATVEMSLESIPPAARDVMILLSGFDASSIAQSVIVKAAERQFRYIDGRSEDEALRPETIEQADALMAIFCPGGKWSESDFNDIVQQCMQYSLLQVTARGNARFYSLHVLVQAYLQSSSARIREHQIGSLVVRLLGSAITVDNHYKYQAFNRLLVPHLKSVAVDDIVEAGDHFGFGQVVGEQGNARLSSEHFERCLALRRSNFGEKHPDTMLAMRDLASSYYYLGRYHEALDLGTKLLTLRKEISGDEHTETLIAMHNLVVFYDELGRYREALELGEKVLDLRKRISGDEHSETLRAMSNLAFSFRSLGRHQEASDLQVEVLDLQKRISGDEHPDTLIVMDSLASSYGELGRNQEALELRLKVLDLRKRILGDEHPDTLGTMGNLALSYSNLERRQEALDLRVKVLDLQKRISGDEHPETLVAMGNLALSYDVLGRRQEALDLRVKVLDLRKRISGDEHPSTLRAMYNLASSYRKLGRYQEALELGMKVVDFQKLTLGDEHPHTLLSMWNHSFTLADLAMKEQEIALLQSALPLFEKVHGFDHFQTTYIKKRLVSLLQSS